MKTDSELQRDVMDELKFEPRIDHSQIGVTAKSGVVTLTGFVPSYAQKVAAEHAARRVKGVKAIAEEIEIRFPSDPKTSDAEIAQRILDVFAWDVTIPNEKIKVKVERGWVTLTGEVEWHYQKDTAQKAAGKIAGVKGISNLIEVHAQPSTVDVHDRIMSAFKRSSTLDASAINIAVEGSTVKLSGRVHGWNERKIAENAAWSAPGVTKVEDNILFA
jgi:osmotically-inducible protein OsmY